MNLTQFKQTYIPIITQALDNYLTFNLSDPRSKLESAIKHSTLAPSKRFRPLLTIATHQLFSVDAKPIIPLACAFEMVHTYSLIHDDLPAMDNDTLRRGLPTCHVKYGQDIAILAGDTLQIYAFELLSKTLHEYFQPEQILKCIQLMSHSFGILGMSGGQVLDLDTLSSKPNSESYLVHTHKLKTGAMIKACIETVTMLHNRPTEEQDTLSQFGAHLGLLFQITDDIIDITSSAETLGKSSQKDIEQNKLTYVSLWGLEGAIKKANQEAEAAYHCLDQLPYDTRLLHEFIDWVSKRDD